MTTYTFDKKDVLNSAIQVEPDVVFSISTKRSSKARRDVTILSNNRGEQVGSILWKGKGLVLFGQEKSLHAIKERPKKFIISNLERVWQWEPNGPRYEATYSNTQWTAKELTTSAFHAVFNSYFPHLFGESEKPSVTFPNGVREFDQMFLLLIFIEMQTRRLDDHRSESSSSSSMLNNNNNILSTNSALGQGTTF